MTTRRIPVALLAIPFLAVSPLACTGESYAPPDPPVVSAVRVANLSPALPAIDFCFSSTGGIVWAGPQMKSMGELGGLPWANPAQQVSKYTGLGTGTYQVRIVGAGAVDCTVPLVTPDVTFGVGADAWYTIIVTGLPTSTSAPLAIHVLTDDVAAPAGQVRLRFVNAAMASATAPSPPLDGGTGAPAAFVPLFPSVAYPGVAAPSATVDANGYRAVDAAALVPGSTVLTACLSGAPVGDCPLSQTYVGPAIPTPYAGTIFAVGVGPSSYRFLTCMDYSSSISTNFGACL